MRRAISVLPTGSWRDVEGIATATLPFDHRYRRRVRMLDDAGEPFLLDLERPATLTDGDGLRLEGGGIIRVRAAEEEVLEASGATMADAARLAWHLGNRHTPVQVLDGGGLRLRHDPVLEAMLRQLGARLVRRRAPFAPEPGAFMASRTSHRHGLDDADEG